MAPWLLPAAVRWTKRLYTKRHRVVENLLAKLKDWRRLATRCDHCAHILRSAALLAATVTFWFRGLILQSAWMR